MLLLLLWLPRWLLLQLLLRLLRLLLLLLCSKGIWSLETLPLIKSEKVSKGRDDVGRKCLNVIVLVGRVFNKRGKGLAP